MNFCLHRSCGNSVIFAKFLSIWSKYHQWYQNITLWHSNIWQNPAEITLAQKFENNKLLLRLLWWPIETLHIMLKNCPKVDCHIFVFCISLVVFTVIALVNACKFFENLALDYFWPMGIGHFNNVKFTSKCT